MRTIQELSHDTFYKMEKYSQIVIDYVEEAQEILQEEDYDDINDKFRDLATLSYGTYSVLEVINPELADDINMLNELQSILEEYLKDVKF
jgi:hypothetical protein